MQNSSTVLIIDDEPAMREALEAILAGGGYQLEFAPDGPPAALHQGTSANVAGTTAARRLESCVAVAIASVP